MGKPATMYQTRYSAQGTLQNDVMPRQVERLMMGIEQMESWQSVGVLVVLSNLKKLCPPYRKAFKDYDKIMDQIRECEALYTEWRVNGRGAQFPLTVSRKLFAIYESWWDAFNSSGAGITMEKYVSKKSRLDQAMMNV